MSEELAELLHQKSKQGAIVGYFGYGSLVNKKTLRTEYIATIPATLSGWQRMWDIPAGNDFDGEIVSLLTVRPNEIQKTKGVLVFDWADNIPLVDAREHNYDRHLIKPDDLSLPETLRTLEHDLFVYEAVTTPEPVNPRPPLLHSYLDAVLQGFHDVYGPDGVHEFMAATANFHTPILNDRDNPKYPRAIELDDEQRDLIDLILSGKEDISFIH